MSWLLDAMGSGASIPFCACFFNDFFSWLCMSHAWSFSDVFHYTCIAMHGTHWHSWLFIHDAVWAVYFLKATPFEPLVVNMPFWERGSIALSLTHCGAPKACLFKETKPWLNHAYSRPWCCLRGWGPGKVLIAIVLILVSKTKTVYRAPWSCILGAINAMEFWSSLGSSRLPIRRAVCGKRKCQSWVAGYSICVCWLHACCQIVAPCVLGWCSWFFCKEEVWIQCCCIWPRIWSTCWKTRDDGFLIFSGVCVCSPVGPSDHIVFI